MSPKTQDTIEEYHNTMQQVYRALESLQAFMKSPQYKRAYAEWEKQELPEDYLLATFKDVLDDLPEALG